MSMLHRLRHGTRSQVRRSGNAQAPDEQETLAGQDRRAHEGFGCLHLRFGAGLSQLERGSDSALQEGLRMNAFLSLHNFHGNPCLLLVDKIASVQKMSEGENSIIYLINSSCI